jgi:hypothetical protein
VRGLDRAAVVAHLKVLPRQAVDAAAAPICDVDGDDDQIRADADDLLLVGRDDGRLLRRDVRLTD